MEWYEALKDKDRRWSEICEMEDQEIMKLFVQLFDKVIKKEQKETTIFYFSRNGQALRVEAKDLHNASKDIIEYIKFYSNDSLVKDTNIKEIFNKNEANETNTIRTR
jgi:hypothetical protein